MILKNVAGQGVYLYEVNTASSPYGPKTGDAANITGSFTLDGTDHTGLGTANPTEIGNGVYWQPLAQGETNGNVVSYRWNSSTSNTYIAPVFAFTSGVNLPTAAPTASGGFPTVGTGAGQFSVDGSGNVHAVDANGNALALASTALSAANWTNTRAAYLDNLSGGAVGSPAQASSLPAHFSSLVINSSGLIQVDLTEVLGTPRALDSVADSSITLSDSLWAAIGAGVGRKDGSSGTSYVISTPSTGTVLRTYAVSLVTPPTQVPDKIA